MAKLGLEVATMRHALLDQPDASFHFDFGEGALATALLLREEAREQVVVARDRAGLGRSLKRC